MNRIDKAILNWNLLWLILCWIGLAIFMMAMPKYCDDYRFMSPFAEWMRNAGVENPDDGVNLWHSSFPWDELKYIWKWHYLNDNSRICNIFAVPALWLPKWLISGTAAIFWGMAMWLSLKLSGINWRYSALVSFAVAAWILLFYWCDTMGCVVFQFNYVISSGLALAYIYWLRNYGERTNWRFRILILFASFFVGGWQEAFSVPIVAGMIIVAILEHKLLKPNVLLALSGMIAGILWISVAPPTAARIIGGSQSMEWAVVTDDIIGHPLFLIDLLIYAIFAWRKGWRTLVADRFMIFCEVSVIISIIMEIVLHGGVRAGWWCDLISVPLLLRMSTKIWPFTENGYRRWSRRFTAVVILLISYLRIGVADVEAFRYRAQLRDAVSIGLSNPNEAIGVDWIYDQFPGLLRGAMPDRALYGYPLTGLREYYGYPDESPFLSMIPKEIFAVSANSASILPGNAGVYEWNGFFFIPLRRNGVEIKQSDISGNLILDSNREAGYIPWVVFRSESDGNDYLLIVFNAERYFGNTPAPSRIDFRRMDSKVETFSIKFSDEHGIF